MIKKIIIDGSYKDDITVVLCKNESVEEFRHQNAVQNFIQGNIYLGKIEKIEPALQAAFVSYGQNRFGFLKLSDIHPKYYDKAKVEKYFGNADYFNKKDEIKLENVEEDDITTVSKQIIHHNPTKQVPVHNLIKVNQTLLVQIEKDERGSKGASLTTFLSLSGRYCVLLLNSNRTNIISKSIDNEEERCRLREIANELSMMQANASIMIKSTAMYKTKLEIARDFGYLVRLWQNIEKCALNTTVPSFIHEEGDIIKKSIRDLYDGEVSEIIIAGEQAYENAYNFVNLLMPKYIHKVKHYTGIMPVFIAYNIHEAIKSLYTDTVSLPSGGYLVINQTEALTSIDINSGRSTNNYSVEETAKLSNLEAAYESVRQIKLRNISGLIVIDFIDMYSQESKDMVEKVIKDGLAVHNTRALVSKMNEFCLITISRQRLGNSLSECIFHKCKECRGKGLIRSYDLTTTAVLKAIYEEISLIQDDKRLIEISTKKDTVMELFNLRKQEIAFIEKQYNVEILLKIDDSATLDTFFIERKRVKNKSAPVAFSSIDKVHYFSSERKHLKKSTTNTCMQSNDDKSNKYDEMNNTISQSKITKFFKNLVKKLSSK